MTISDYQISSVIRTYMKNMKLVVEYDGTGPGGKFMIRLPVFNFTKMEAE